MGKSKWIEPIGLNLYNLWRGRGKGAVRFSIVNPYQN
jgi:hypothetical protein